MGMVDVEKNSKYKITAEKVRKKKILKEKMLMLMVMDLWVQCFILVVLYQENLLKLI